MLNKRDFLHLLILFACAALLLSPVLCTGKTFFLRDLTSLFHPWRTFAAETMQAGRIPLWDPYAYCGMPLLANWQSAILYPFTILFYLFPFAAALKAFGLLHFFLAGLFAYLFGKKNGLNRPGALGLALVFAFNGYMVTRSEFLSHFSVDAWTFALLLLIDAPLLLALALSISFMAGHQVFLLQVVIVAAYWLSGGSKRPEGASPRSMAVAFLCMTALSAVQLLPTAELAGLSSRVRQGVDAAFALTNALKFSDLARFVSPVFPSSIPPITGEKLPWPTTFHVGFIAFAVALLALARDRTSRHKGFAVFLAVTGLIFALGAGTPVYPWLYDHLPVLHLMRYPAQYLLLTVAGTAILAGAGFARFGYAAVFLCAVEVLVSGFAFQATAPDSFFTVRPPTVKMLSAEAGRDRFILSPGTEAQRYIRGADIPGAWQTARSYLYGLTCLPYHLRNAYGSGEPLVPASVEAMVNAAYERPDPQSALPYFDALGVRNLLARTPFPDATGYQLASTEPLARYRLRSPSGMLVLSGTSRVLADDRVPGRTRFVIHSKEEQTVTWKETSCPGWELYVNGARTGYTAGGTFRQWRVGPGISHTVELYRPLSFRIGLLITLAAAVFLLICGIMRMGII